MSNYSKYPCNMCGNEINQPRCPYCDVNNQAEYFGNINKNKKIITINIEKNMPSIQEAKILVDKEISDAKLQGVKIIKFIHGYGSSGVGGSLKQSVQNYLRSKKLQKVITGENLNSDNNELKQILHDFPKLKKDRDFNNYNEGITIVLI